MRLPRLTAPAVLALLLAAGPAPAQPFNYRYEFDLPGGTPSPTFTIPVGGQTVDVALYLVETDAAGTLRTSGLFSAGVRLGYPAASPAKVQAVSDITRNPGFDQQVGTTVDALGAVLSEQAFSNPAVTAPAADPNRILLGTFRLTRGSGNGSVTLTAADLGPSSDTLTGT